MKVGIIGGGAAGLVAAIRAARDGHDVTILEHMERVGKKILSTGNGKCNLTNVDQGAEHYHGTHPDFAVRVLNQCGYQTTLHFFTELGIYTRNRNGGLYPYSEQASAVLDVLRIAIAELGVKVICGINVEQIEHRDQFQVWTAKTGTAAKKECYRFDRLILATGGMAAKSTGSDGSGYRLAASLGHRIIKPLPALVQLKSPQDYFKSIAGIRCEAGLHLYMDDTYVCSEQGELQLTNYGISGIPVFQLSGRVARALYEKKSVRIQIDFMPDMPTVEALTEYLARRAVTAPHKLLQEWMIGLFHKNLCALFLKQCHLKGICRAAELTSQEIAALARCIKQFDVPISDTNSFEQAQTCSGGVDTAELKDTLESRLVPGLFFAGEIMDINGDCGGYNLQWAWSTGMLSASALSL